jgi:hypothetical protein
MRIKQLLGLVTADWTAKSTAPVRGCQRDGGHRTGSPVSVTRTGGHTLSHFFFLSRTTERVVRGRFSADALRLFVKFQWVIR